MCDVVNDIWCERYFLQSELERLMISQVTTDQNGYEYLSLNLVKAIIKKLECENV